MLERLEVCLPVVVVVVSMFRTIGMVGELFVEFLQADKLAGAAQFSFCRVYGSAMLSDFQVYAIAQSL